jgi:hypothetical protein
MNTNVLIEPVSSAKGRLRFFTLYADYPAGIRARRLATQVKHLAAKDWDVVAEMWKLDSVAPVGPIREMIAQEAGESDILLIAVSSVAGPHPELTAWLSSLVNWKANRLVPGLLLGLFGEEDRDAESENAMAEQLAAFARKTQMSFAWQAAGNETFHNSEWLAAELERLLEKKRACAP